SIASVISSLFNVDTYIGLFDSGWIGIILRWLRSNGFINDIATPIAILRFNDVLSTIVPILTFVVFFAIVVCIIYCVQLKKQNATIIYLCYYTLMGCSIISVGGVIIEIIEFVRMINAVADGFNMNGFILFFIIIECLSAYIYTNRFHNGFEAISKQHQLHYWSWNQIKEKVHLKTSVQDSYIKEKDIVQIIGIGTFVFLLVFIIKCSLFAGSHEAIESARKSTELEVYLSESFTENKTLQQQKMAEKIQAFYVNLSTTKQYDWSITTTRFYERMKDEAMEADIFRACQDCPSGEVVVSNYYGIDNIYEVQLMDEYGNLFLDVIWLMMNIDGELKLDNLIYTSKGSNYNSYLNTNQLYIDYSKCY
ncbi:MAG: hypothetical protein KBS40_03250, partial [Bacteroidales bacterium]|nr:hypothetical protein [Bacteroidales bacterium]